ncbi:MAG: T9SS type A sorting domain-containing protein [Bacteroidia bacterium]
MIRNYFILIYCFSFSQSLLGQNWIQKANYPQHAAYCAGFAIDGYGYIGLGFNPFSNDTFYKYDTLQNNWTYVTTFPGSAREMTVSFSINGKGYVCTGSAGTKTKEFWEYDPITNTWIQKADFGGGKRDNAVCTVINGKAYVGTGIDSGNFKKDFWEYDPLTDIWTPKSDFPGGERWCAVAFELNGKGYFGMGTDSSYNYYNDFWQYDPNNDSWIQVANFGGLARMRSCSFTLNNEAYVGTGRGTLQTLDDFWKYNDTTNSWTLIGTLGGILRQYGVAFTIGNYGYVGTGADIGAPYLNDFWQFDPYNISSNMEGQAENEYDLFPNPCRDKFMLHFPINLTNIDVMIYNSLGKRELFIENISGNEIAIHCNNLSEGIYSLVIIKDCSIKYRDKFIIQ